MARAMGGKKVAIAIATGAMSVGLLAACGSSGGSGGSNNSPSPAAFNEATAKTQITTNWENFFDQSKPVASKDALLQDATALHDVLVAQDSSDAAKGSTAKVKSVVIDPSHTSATVTYDLLVNGSPQLTGSTGTAVLDGGVWKVSKASFCGLIALGAQAAGTTPPPVCAS